MPVFLLQAPLEYKYLALITNQGVTSKSFRVFCGSFQRRIGFQ